MRAIRSGNTKPERALRSVLFQMGYRFRVQFRQAAGSPDIAFPSRRKAIFVHGCFWHRHCGCPKSYQPKSREAFWNEKFARNLERDARTMAALHAAGWEALVVWECEAVDGDSLREQLANFVGPTRSNPDKHDRSRHRP
jgi:DNA mismatch endonuclease (patch repair protein)